MSGHSVQPQLPSGLSRLLPLAAGLHEPRETVYLRAAALPELPPLLALLIVSNLQRCAIGLPEGSSSWCLSVHIPKLIRTGCTYRHMTRAPGCILSNGHDRARHDCRYAVGAASGRLLVRRDRRPAGPDPASLTAGLAVLLRQHHPANLQVLARRTPRNMPSRRPKVAASVSCIKLARAAVASDALLNASHVLSVADHDMKAACPRIMLECPRVASQSQQTGATSPLAIPVHWTRLKVRRCCCSTWVRWCACCWRAPPTRRRAAWRLRAWRWASLRRCAA